MDNGAGSGVVRWDFNGEGEHGVKVELIEIVYYDEGTGDTRIVWGDGRSVTIKGDYAKILNDRWEEAIRDHE